MEKKRLDFLNWAKSELKQETNSKIGKTQNPYRFEKIKFLTRVISWLEEVEDCVLKCNKNGKT